MDDAELVAAGRAGDRSAYAAIYDRYADRIYDFCASLLRDRADAAEALQETFLVAFESLDDLAEPARLRSWLYALAHRSVRDRIERHGGLLYAPDAELTEGGADERLSRPELAEFVWMGARDLNLGDRVVLDLHLRQGLEGRDLAGATGIPAAALEARLPGLEARVDRALGALLVARTVRRSCPELFAVLAGGDGTLSREFRDQVTAHVDGCERCNSRRRIAPSPLALLAAMPLTAAPDYLHDVILGKAELSKVERESAAGRDRLIARAGWTFQRDGFPDLSGVALEAVGSRERATGPVFASTRPTSVVPMVERTTTHTTATRTTTSVPPDDPPARTPSPDQDRRGMLVGALLGLIVLIAGAVIVLSGRGKKPLSVGVTSSTSAVAATTVINTTTTTTVPAVIAATTIPATTVMAIGRLSVAAKPVDLAVTATSASLQLGNDGGASVDFTATASGVGLTVAPVTGTVGPGATQFLTVTFDRAAASPGPFTGAIIVNSPGHNVTVTVNAIVDPGPMISGELATPAMLSTGPKCLVKPGPLTSTVTATVTASQPVSVVVLHAKLLPFGLEVPSNMTLTGTTYLGTLGPYTAPGNVDWWVTAVDSAKVTGVSTHHTLVVSCP